jgi:hypothetical protein
MLNKHNLAIASLASKEESRFTLNAILVTPECTIETDGHQLVMVTTPKDVPVDSFPQVPGIPPATLDFKPFLLPAAEAQKIAKSLPKKTTIPALLHAGISTPADDSEDNLIFVTDPEAAQSFRIRKVKGNFPDHNRVMPKPDDSRFQIALDARLLRTVLGTLDSFVDSRQNAPVRFYFKSPNEALRIDADNGETGQHMTAVVMPMREGNKEELKSGYFRELTNRPEFKAWHDRHPALYSLAPWTVQQAAHDADGAPLTISDASGRPVAYIASPADPQSEYNARLIAAAPALFSQLETLADFLPYNRRADLFTLLLGITQPAKAEGAEPETEAVAIAAPADIEEPVTTPEPEPEPVQAAPVELPDRNGTPFTNRMQAAADANEGRTLIREHEAVIHDLETGLGLEPTVGENGGGFGYRGFSTVSASEWKAAIKRVKDLDAFDGRRLDALIADGQAMRAPWERLSKIELGTSAEEHGVKPARAQYDRVSGKYAKPKPEPKPAGTVDRGAAARKAWETIRAKRAAAAAAASQNGAAA